MQKVVPDYYKHFRCIADKCKNNCCIGWEIDIDEKSLDFYKTIEGEIGERLKKNISFEGTPHFVLGEKERCPFLNGNNLCDIITELGEEHICGICTEHPRFNNELPDRIETGIGLCCEEAARLILSRKDPVVLEKTGEACFDEIVEKRDKAILLLQNRSKSLDDRIKDMLELCDARMPEESVKYWADILLSLERLDDRWTSLVEKLKDHADKADLKAFDEYMADRQTEYEQILVYFIYRHLANACDEEDLAARASFAVFGYKIIYFIGAILWKENGCFSTEDNAETARLFSSEIEYSEENMDIMLEEMI